MKRNKDTGNNTTKNKFPPLSEVKAMSQESRSYLAVLIHDIQKIITEGGSDKITKIQNSLDTWTTFINLHHSKPMQVVTLDEISP